MPNVLVRGHMRFHSDDDCILQDRIKKLEREVDCLQKELDESIKTQAHWNKENERLKRKSLDIENRRAKRDSLVNALEIFEKDVAEIAQYRNIAGPGADWVDVNVQTEDEIVAEFHQRLLEMMTTAQCLYPNITLERIFRK